MAELADAEDLKSSGAILESSSLSPGTSQEMGMAWLIVVLGYFLGCIPTGYIVGRVLRGVDIRQIGDGNTGAANVFHQIGPKAGVVVGIVDATKGALSVLIAQAAGVSEVVVMLSGAAAVVGHNWPIFLHFRGGRGESTAIGVLSTLLTQPMAIVAVPTIATLVIKKNVILASAVLFVPLSLLAWLFGWGPPLIIYSIGLPCLVGFTHFLRTRGEPDATKTRNA